MVLATSASVNLNLEPIYSDAVWGAGWYNAANYAHYADGAIHYEGEVAIDFQASDDFWDLMMDWIVLNRAYPKSLDISPDGSHVYHYWTTGAYGADYDLKGAWNNSASFSTSAGSLVTSSLGVYAISRTETDPAGGTTFSNYSYVKQQKGVITGDCTQFSPSNPLNPSGNNVDPIPFWRTNAQLLTGTYSAPFSGGAVPQANMETVSWDVSVTQNIVPLYTCSGSRLARAILQGPIDASGNATLYHPEGVFDPILGPSQTGTLTSPYLRAENTWFRVEIARGGVNPSVFLELPAVVIASDDYSIAGKSDVTNRSFSLTGLGGRCVSGGTGVVIPPFVMSDSNGAYTPPT